VGEEVRISDAAEAKSLVRVLQFAIGWIKVTVDVNSVGRESRPPFLEPVDDRVAIVGTVTDFHFEHGTWRDG
jgi:hypothetical protein